MGRSLSQLLPTALFQAVVPGLAVLPDRLLQRQRTEAPEPGQGLGRRLLRRRLGRARPLQLPTHRADGLRKREPAWGDQAVALLPCREAQAKFLGQDFNTRLAVELWVASDASWYRCDVLLRNSTRATQGYQSLTGSLKGVLRHGTSIDLQACLNAAYDPAVDQTYVSCREPHVSRELAVAPAIGTLDEPLPNDVAQRAVSACNATASAEGQLLPDRIVTAFYPETADAWASRAHRRLLGHRDRRHAARVDGATALTRPHRGPCGHHPRA